MTDEPLDAHTAAHALEITTAELATIRRVGLIKGAYRGERGRWFYCLNEVRRVAGLIAKGRRNV